MASSVEGATVVKPVPNDTASSEASSAPNRAVVRCFWTRGNTELTINLIPPRKLHSKRKFRHPTAILSPKHHST